MKLKKEQFFLSHGAEQQTIFDSEVNANLMGKERKCASMEIGNNTGIRSIQLQCSFMRYYSVRTNILPHLPSQAYWDEATSKYKFKFFSDVEMMHVSSKLKTCHPFTWKSVK